MGQRTVKVTIEAAVTGAIANVKAFRGALVGLDSELSKMGKEHPARFNKLAMASGAAGLAMVGAFGYVVKAAMDFDKQMSNVAAVSDASGKSLESLRAAALKAGKDTQYSATQAAAAESELAKAGISVRDILGGGLKGTLSLAAAGQMDLANAATIAAQAMNIFQLRGSAVGHIADVLAAGSNKSAADMQGLGDSLKQGGLAAAQAGLTLEDTVGVLSAFADRGLVASDAGTSLKSMLAQLQAPSKVSAALMAQLGINAYDATGKFVGIVALAGQLRDKLGGLTQAQRDQALAQIFGTDAMRAASVLYNQGADGIKGYITAVDDSGAASKVAAEKMNNLGGDVERLKGSMQTLAIASGSGANTGLRKLAQAADGLLGVFIDLPGPVQTTLTILAGVTGVTLLAGTGFLKAKQTAAELLQSLRDMGPGGERAANGLSKVGSAAGKIGAVGAVALVGYEGISALVGYINDHSGPAKANVDELTKSLKSFADTGKATGELSKTFGADLARLSKDIAAVKKAESELAAARATAARAAYVGTTGRGGSGGKVPGGSEDQLKARQNLTDLDNALATMAANGGVAQAQIAFQRLAASQGLSQSQTAALLDMLPKYKAAAADAALGTTGMAAGFGDAATNARTLAQGLDAAVAKGLKLLDVWNQLYGATAQVDDKMLTANRSVAALGESLKANKNAIEGNSTAALENRTAIEAVARAAADAADAKYQETGSLDQAMAVYNSYVAQLHDVLKAAGFTEAQIKKLIETYMKMPPVITTQIKALGVDGANQMVTEFSRKLDKINGRIVTTYVIVDTVTGQKTYVKNPGRSFNATGGIYEHAATGALRDASVYSATAYGARYAFAEPSTRGEAFIPKRGNLGRSRSIADYVVSNWLGGAVSWGGPGGAGGSGGPSTLNLAATFVLPSGEVVHRQMITYALDTGRAPADLWPTARR